MKFDLTVKGVIGKGPAAGRLIAADMGGALFRAICESGNDGVAQFAFGTLPLLGIPGLPEQTYMYAPFDGPLSPVGGDYTDLSNANGVDDRIYQVLLSDAAFTPTNPVPTFREWCEDLGGIYTQT